VDGLCEIIIKPVEIFLLNGIVGVAAGEQCRKSGLIAAVGAHFWTDIFWHVLWGLLF
jgi:hypothetical protein